MIILQLPILFTVNANYVIISIYLFMPRIKEKKNKIANKMSLTSNFQETGIYKLFDNAHELANMFRI